MKRNGHRPSDHGGARCGASRQRESCVNFVNEMMIYKVLRVRRNDVSGCLRWKHPLAHWSGRADVPVPRCPASPDGLAAGSAYRRTAKVALGGVGVSLDTSTTRVAGVSIEVSSTFVRGANVVDSISTRASTAPARPRRSRSPNRARCSARKFVQGWRRARRSMGSTPGSATACAFRGAAACPGRKRRDDWLFGRREKDFMVSNKSVMGNLKAFCAVLHRPEQTG